MTNLTIEEKAKLYNEKCQIFNDNYHLKEITSKEFYRVIFGKGNLRIDEDIINDGTVRGFIKYQVDNNSFNYYRNQLVAETQKQLYKYEYDLSQYKENDKLFLYYTVLDLAIDTIVHQSKSSIIKERLKIIKNECKRTIYKKYGSDILLSIIENFEKKDERIKKSQRMHRKSQRQVIKSLPIYDNLDAIELAKNNVKANICPVGYYGRNAVANNASVLYAFNIDIDYVSPDNLNNLLKGIEDGRYPKPTLLVNSGNGVHVYYVFDEPLQLPKSVRADVSMFKQRLVDLLWNDETSMSSDRDKQGYLQDTRAVGSLTKLGKGYVTRGYSWDNAGLVSIEYLETFIQTDNDGAPLSKLRVKPLNITTKELDTMKEELIHRLPEYEKEILNAKYSVKQLNAGLANPPWFVMNVLHQYYDRKFIVNPKAYSNFIKEVKENWKVGHRYKCCSMLFVLGYKCGISKEQIINDIQEQLMGLFNRNSDESNNFTLGDIKAASAWYNTKAVTVSRRYMFEYAGVPYKEANKRNEAYNIEGKTQQQVHLEKARKKAMEEGKLKGRPKSTESKNKDMIIEYIKTHQDYNKSRIAKELGINRKTVDRWLPEAEKEVLGAERIKGINNKNEVDNGIESDDEVSSLGKKVKKIVEADSIKISFDDDADEEYISMCKSCIDELDITSNRNVGAKEQIINRLREAYDGFGKGIYKVENLRRFLYEVNTFDKMIDEKAVMIKEKRQKERAEEDRKQERMSIIMQMVRKDIIDEQAIKFFERAIMDEDECRARKKEEEDRKKAMERARQEANPLAKVVDDKGRVWTLINQMLVDVDGEQYEYDKAHRTKPEDFKSLVELTNYKVKSLGLTSLNIGYMQAWIEYYLGKKANKHKFSKN